MKVRADQLEQQLKKNFAPLYIISGDDVLLCQEAADSIRKAAQKHQIDERLRFVADAQFDWQEVINENQSLSLFSSRRLFDIQIDKMGEKHSKALAQLGQSLSEDNTILLTLPKIDARTQKAKWFTQLESQGVFVQVWPIDANRLPAWVQQRAQSLNLSLSREAASIICERGEHAVERRGREGSLERRESLTGHEHREINDDELGARIQRHRRGRPHPYAARISAKHGRPASIRPSRSPVEVRRQAPAETRELTERQRRGALVVVAEKRNRIRVGVRGRHERPVDRILGERIPTHHRPLG